MIWRVIIRDAMETYEETKSLFFAGGHWGLVS